MHKPAGGRCPRREEYRVERQTNPGPAARVSAALVSPSTAPSEANGIHVRVRECFRARNTHTQDLAGAVSTQQVAVIIVSLEGNALSCSNSRLT